MTDTPSTRSAPASRRASAEPTAWTGWVVFAGVMMVLVGTFEAIDGLVALFNDDLYVVRPNGLVVNLDYTAWGWVHLLLGILLIVAGVSVLSGRTWARAVGVLAALLSAVVNFGFLPAYPIWSTLMIVIDVIVIYALIAHGRELRNDEAYF